MTKDAHKIENLIKCRDRIQHMEPGPDDEGTNRLLMNIIFDQDWRKLAPNKSCPSELVFVDPETDRWVSTYPFKFVSSLSESVLFVERFLPGWRWMVASDCDALLSHPSGEWAAPIAASGEILALSPPRGLLIAALNAVIAGKAQPCVRAA